MIYKHEFLVRLTIDFDFYSEKNIFWRIYVILYCLGDTLLDFGLQANSNKYSFNTTAFTELDNSIKFVWLPCTFFSDAMFISGT